jgi:hypothetical protein
MGMVHECEQGVQALLPELPRPEQKALAALVSGVVLAGSAELGRAAAAAPGPARDGSKERRAQRLLANPRLEVARAQRRLLARVLRGRRGRVDLVLDATTTGATAGQAGTRTLVLAVAWHRRALPLVWRSWTADAPGQDWAGAIPEMPALAQAALPADAQAVLLADRGLSGGPLARAARAVGWHFLLRAQAQTRVLAPDGRAVALGTLAPAPGTAAYLDGVRAWAPRAHRPAEARPWADGLAANAVAVWRAADPEPWLLLTDLPAAPARCAEYRRSTWEEQLFRDLKGVGCGSAPACAGPRGSSASCSCSPWPPSGSPASPSGCSAAAGAPSRRAAPAAASAPSNSASAGSDANSPTTATRPAPSPSGPKPPPR